MMEGKPVVIFGEGSATRDYTYIDDAIKAYIAAFEMPVDTDNFVVNIGTGKEVSIKEIAVEYLPANGFAWKKPVYVEQNMPTLEEMIKGGNQ